MVIRAESVILGLSNGHLAMLALEMGTITRQTFGQRAGKPQKFNLAWLEFGRHVKESNRKGCECLRSGSRVQS